MSLLSSLTAVPMLSVLFDRQDTNVFFLYPTAPGELPIADTRVQGNVILDLPSDRTVSTITLELVRPAYMRPSARLMEPCSLASKDFGTKVDSGR